MRRIKCNKIIQVYLSHSPVTQNKTKQKKPTNIQQQKKDVPGQGKKKILVMWNMDKNQHVPPHLDSVSNQWPLNILHLTDGQ